MRTEDPFHAEQIQEINGLVVVCLTAALGLVALLSVVVLVR